MIYSDQQKSSIRGLRQQGYTYAEIRIILNIFIPNSSLTYICKGIELSTKQRDRINSIIQKNSHKAREKALIVNRVNFDNKLRLLREKNKYLGHVIDSSDVKLIALAMLYLGEGAKWDRSRGLKLSSANPDILILYTSLLRECFGVNKEVLRCRVQHRADQDSGTLIDYWSETLKINKDNFYKCYVDKRTIGQKTGRADYRGVCMVSCAGTNVQLELQEIAGIIIRKIRGISAVG